MDVTPTDMPMVWAIVDKESYKILANFRVSHRGSYMQNAQLASGIMETYEKYYKEISKNNKRK